MVCFFLSVSTTKLFNTLLLIYYLITFLEITICGLILIVTFRIYRNALKRIKPICIFTGYWIYINKLTSYWPSCFLIPLPILLLQRLFMRVGSARRHSRQPAQFLLMTPEDIIIPGAGVLKDGLDGPCALPCGEGNPVTEKGERSK